ncbi:MAG: radical SAM protein, partial [Chromatiales bacterium]
MARIEPTDIPSALIARYAATPARQGSERVFATPRSISAREYADALPRTSASNDEPVSLYVHLPFCPVRCLNCDNNTTITHSACEIDRYLDALDREMALLAGHIGEGHQVAQLHMGGGSPNYLTEPQLLRLVDILERHFAIDEYTESSLEANPKRTSSSQLDLLHGLGFRRVNFAVRDVDPGVQHAIGRVQSLEMIDDAFCSAREAGFDTISMDLMYGLPCQTTDSIQRTVEDVLALGPDRVSCFSYTRQPDRFVHQRAIEPSQMPSLADKLSLFSTIVDGLTDASY